MGRDFFLYLGRVRLGGRGSRRRIRSIGPSLMLGPGGTELFVKVLGNLKQAKVSSVTVPKVKSREGEGSKRKKSWSGII